MKTVEMLTFVEAHHPPAEISPYRSTDDGRTWKKRQQKSLRQMAISRRCDMNDHGITLRQFPKGVLSDQHAGTPENDQSGRNITPMPSTVMMAEKRGAPANHSRKMAQVKQRYELSDGRLYNSVFTGRNARSKYKDPPSGRRITEKLDPRTTLPDGQQHRSYDMGGLTFVDHRPRHPDFQQH